MNFSVFSQVQFVLSAPTFHDAPKTSYPEVAFIGRSNVGKSSLINALTNQSHLARVSNTPGRTQCLNFFLLPNLAYIVDMPGYGYAKAPEHLKDEWSDLISDYLLKRSTLKRLYVLIDARHGIKKNDGQMLDFLDKNAISYQLILTKTDKVRPSKKLLDIAATTQFQIQSHPACYPELLFTSAEKKEGINNLRAAIFDLLR
jgi:GTP-binding protein